MTPARSIGARIEAASTRFGSYPVAVIVYVVVKYFRGWDSVVRVHDHLDHLQAVYSRMSLGDLFAAPGATLDFTLGGLPRGFVGSEFAVGTVIAVVLPLLAGLIVAELLYRFVAYYGMRRLLRDLGLDQSALVHVGIPTLFALMPFYHPAFASIAGLPLLLSALVRIHHRPERIDYAIVAAFPLLGMAQATIPYAVLLAGYGIGRWVVRRRVDAVVRSVGLYLLSLVVVEWRLVHSVLFGPESNRLGFVPRGDAALSTEIFSVGRAALETVEKHAAHASNFVVPAVIGMIGAAIAIAVVSRRQRDPADGVLFAASAALAGVLAFAAGWPLLDDWVVRRVLGDYPRVQIDRVLWIVPAVTMLVLAAAATGLLSRAGQWKGGVAAVVAFVFALQGVAFWSEADFSEPPLAQLTIDEFYAPDQFAGVKEIVDADGGGRVVAVGFDPSVALYNGFDTADGAWFSYPLEYKTRWSALIAPAMEADAAIRSYFEGYGNRVYVFQPAFGTSFCCEIPDVDSYELFVDPGSFDDLAIEHVLSNGEVLNAAELGLTRIGEVAGESYATIVVYRT